MRVSVTLVQLGEFEVGLPGSAGCVLKVNDAPFELVEPAEFVHTQRYIFPSSPVTGLIVRVDVAGLVPGQLWVSE